MDPPPSILCVLLSFLLNYSLLISYTFTSSYVKLTLYLRCFIYVFFNYPKLVPLVKIVQKSSHWQSALFLFLSLFGRKERIPLLLPVPFRLPSPFSLSFPSPAVRPFPSLSFLSFPPFSMSIINFHSPLSLYSPPPSIFCSLSPDIPRGVTCTAPPPPRGHRVGLGVTGVPLPPLPPSSLPPRPLVVLFYYFVLPSFPSIQR